MAEYIERDKARRMLFESVKKYPTSFAVGIGAACYELDKMQAADVEEVVRCCDCKHLAVVNTKSLYAFCTKTMIQFEPFKEDTRKHFCSYGERKEGSL